MKLAMYRSKATICCMGVLFVVHAYIHISIVNSPSKTNNDKRHESMKFILIAICGYTFITYTPCDKIFINVVQNAFCCA